MEPETIHPETIESEGKVRPTYSVVVFPSMELPLNYHPMIYSRWLRSLRFGNPLFKKVDSKEYYKNYHAYLESVLKKPDCKVRLAVLSDDDDVVLGFSVSRGEILDYVNVHTHHRMLGIGTALIPPDIKVFTHVTIAGLEIWQRKHKDWKFNPFA
jgi:hypothetical protein